MSEESSMNPNVRETFQRVAQGTADRVDLAHFKVSANALGWEGVRGGGVHNHIEGTRVKSWAALAAHLLEANKREELGDVEEAEAAEMESDVRAILAEANVGAPAEVHEEIRFVYFYTTRVPTVSISDMTTVDAYLTEEVEGGAPEGTCQSGAALDCTGYGWLRVLPESMLPGNELEQCIQCIPCHEASAAAYVRKLHVAEAES
jgi:hypothetical protein